MKNKFLNSLVCAASIAFAAMAHAQSTIAYFSGPSFEFGDPYADGAPLDLD